MGKKFMSFVPGLSQFLQMPMNVFLTRFLPWRGLRLYVISLGFLYYVFRGAERRKIRMALAHALRGKTQYTGFSMIVLLLKAYVGIFEHYYEKLVMAHRDLPAMKQHFRKRFVESEQPELAKVLASGKGAILVTGHFGAVEFFPLALHLLGVPVAMICKFKTNSLRENLFAKAIANGVTLIDADEPNVAIKALKEVAKGKVLITECDEFKAWRGSADRQVQVFGHAFPMDKTLDFFHRRSGVPVLLGLIRRDRGRLHLDIERIADGLEKVAVSAAAWDLLEKNILRHPEQWYQWKDAYKALEQFIHEPQKTKEQHLDESAQVPLLPSRHPLSPANLS